MPTRIKLEPERGATGGSVDASAVAAGARASVVNVDTTITGGHGQVEAEGAGTGIIVSSSGEILTNNHVVDEASTISVHIPDHSAAYSAIVLGVDRSADVALIAVSGVSGLATAALADTSNLQVGQPVVNVGNAGGTGGAPTVTRGEITALNQHIVAQSDQGTSEPLAGLIRSNAPIEAGDSGGPLLNSASQVIGMTTAGQGGSDEQSSQSTVGYAIPMNTAVPILNEILAGRTDGGVTLGRVGYLGVEVEDLNAATASQLGLSVRSGPLVVGFTGKSPARAAGMPLDAVITEVNGHPVGSTASLQSVMLQTKPGQHVSVTWMTRSGSHSATVTLTTGPAV